MTAFFFLTWHTHNSIEHRDTIGLKNRRRGERNCSFRATRKMNAIGITKRPSTPPAQRPRFHSRLRMGGRGRGNETRALKKKKNEADNVCGNDKAPVCTTRHLDGAQK